MRTRLALVHVATFWLAAAPSFAQTLIVPVAQERRIAADASYEGQPSSANSAEAPDFARFNRTVSASAGESAGSYVTASARQDSTIGENRIVAGSQVVARFVFPHQRVGARASSTFDVTFDLLAQHDYLLVSSADPKNGSHHFDLTFSGPDGVIAHLGPFGSMQGVLPAGRYRLQSSTTVDEPGEDTYFGGLSGSFSFDVSDPAPPSPPKPRYSLTGRFTTHRGALLDLPLAGAEPCSAITRMSGPGATMVGAPANGCVPLASHVAIHQSAVGKRGTFVLPANALRQQAPGAPNWGEVANATPMQQVQTSLAFANQAAALVGSAWKGHAGRANPDFTWIAPGGPAIVKYLAGPNRFGGTMAMVISAGPNASQLVQTIAAGPATFRPLQVTGTIPTGAGYAWKKTDPAVDGSGWLQHMSTSMGRITMGTNYLGPRPGATAMHYGFPFTTGRVIVRRTGTEFGAAATTTISAEGGDEVTSMGARQLSLVAGGLSLSGSPLAAPELGIAQLALPEPGAAAQRSAAVLALLGVAAWRRWRRRR